VVSRKTFSPTSIANFLTCQHLAALNRAAAAGEIKKPYFDDPGRELLRKLGEAHEQAYLKQLAEDSSLRIASIPADADTSWKKAAAQTIEAMRGGADVVYQAAFLADEWYGRADFLRRVDKPSALGDWSYEVVETKLARSTKARAIIQLCFYSDLLSQIQGVVPDYMHVVLGGNVQPEKFFVQRYLAYFRKVKNEFFAASQVESNTYPEPVEHCRICDWSTVCDEQWRADDHLSLVANISRNQRRALVDYGVVTLAGLGKLPPDPKVEGIKDQALANIHQQARLQLRGREEHRYVYELLEPPEPEKGLCSLPAASPGDMFLDFEGDQLTIESGLEYLFGVVTLENGAPIYSPSWAMNKPEEKEQFKHFIENVRTRLQQYPDMHVYHYGPYEATAIKRMAGQHNICGDEVDELLRGGVLVDLYRVVRQGLRASVESYSIKKLEPLYGFKREVQLVDANRALTTFQTVLAFGDGGEDIQEIRDAIVGYNRDDCISTLRLRDWLEERRRDLETKFGPQPRPLLKDPEPTEDLSAYLEQVRAIESRLTRDIPDDESERTSEQQARWLMAQLLEWHRREEKSAWWKYFELCSFTDEQLQEDKSALGGLVYEGIVGQVKKSLIHRYRFPLQDHSIDRAAAVHDPKTQKSAGEVVEIDERNLTIDIKRGVNSATPHPTALIPNDVFNSKTMRESLLSIGSWIAENEITGPGSYTVARELLMRKAPRLKNGSLANTVELPMVEAAKQIALQLDDSALPIQGPPGSGKTFTGARMIVELVKSGRKVGITAVSHKVISNLLEATCKAAKDEEVALKIIQKCDGDDICNNPMVKAAKDNEAVVQALASSEVQLAAGTVWLWSRPEMANSVDVLFVDEAGQMSLANVLAASQSTASIVLLGDPQQLDQPQRGVHPPGAESSALSHLLNGRPTIGAEQGLFLAESWRLHPDICRFTSEVFYEARLKPRPENANQRINTKRSLNGTGLRFAPVTHFGNQSESLEEVERVGQIVEALLRGDSTWTNKDGQVALLLLQNILIVAPYNAQVSALARRLPAGARIGTVDKFQGQEAPVVIYSMATSTPEDAPRGMEFLYSANRLNVATSRAQCLTILVANPDLFNVQCKTPRQIELANAFCRYLEMASEI
jgi:uncharacterized protein